MIVIDTSVLIAVLAREPERPAFLRIIADADRRLISALTVYETGIVRRARTGPDGITDLTDLLEEIDPEIIPFDLAHARLALDAYGIYGKGIHPKTRLNLCDCAAYALAKAMNVPLLFKGEDFKGTDITAA